MHCFNSPLDSRALRGYIAAVMGLIDRVDMLARDSAESRRAEIEKLLAQNAGKLLRASELPQPVAKAPERDVLAECLAAMTPIQHGDARVLVRSIPVPAIPLPGDAQVSARPNYLRLRAYSVVAR